MKIIVHNDSIDNIRTIIEAPGDSGGIQKEAYMLGVPCITLRGNTEWIETLEGGRNILTGADKSKIIEGAQKSIPICIQQNIFSGKSASKKILDILDHNE